MASKPFRRGQGTPVTPGEKRRYDQLRGAGWSPEAAAESLGRSRSWAYNYEKEKNGYLRKSREPIPSDDLREAVELIIAASNDDLDRSFEIFDRYSALIVPFLTQVAWILAEERAVSENRHLRVLLEDTSMAEEHAKNPITPEDILNAIPVALRGTGKWYRLAVPRVEEWMARLCEMFPELAEIEAQARAAEEADDPEAAVDALTRERPKTSLMEALL